MATKLTYKITGFAVLVVGILFFLRDVGLNYIGNTSGWSILIVILGAALLAGGNIELSKPTKRVQQPRP